MIISSAILLMILLPTILSILLSLPIIQNKIISSAALFASDYLQTEVSMGRINVSMQGEVEIRDFLARDLQGDTLLYVKELSTPLLGFSLRDKQVSLGRSTIKGAKLNLAVRMVDGESVMNIKQIVNLISSGASENPLKISSSSVVLSDFDLSIKQLNRRNPIYGVDYGDIEMRGIAASVDDLMVDGPRVTALINSVSTTEKSGFELRHASGRLRVSRGAVTMEDLLVESAESRLQFSRLMLSSREWSQYKRFNQNVLLNIRLNSGYLSSNDVAYFAPKLKDWDIRLYDMKLNALGEVDGLAIDVDNISYGYDSHVSTKLELRRVSQLDNAYALFEMRAVVVDPSDAYTLITSIDPDMLSKRSADMINSVGRITINGRAEGQLDRILFDGLVKSGLGDITSKINVDIQNRDSIAFAGKVDIDSFHLGKLLGKREIGRFSASTQLDGMLGRKNNSRLWLSSRVSSFNLNGYDIRNTVVEGELDRDDIEGRVVCNDESLLLDAIARIDNLSALKREDRSPDKIAKVELSSYIEYADIKALGLNTRDESSELSGKIEISAEGEDIDNISGGLRISDANYNFNDNHIATSLISVDMRDTRHGRIFTLNSEFADVVMNLSGSPTDNLNYLKGALYDYLPALYESTSYRSGDLFYSPTTDSSSQKSATENERNEGVASSESDRSSSTHLSLINVKLHNITPIAEAFDSDIEASEDTKGLLLFDPINRGFTVTFSSSYIERNAFLAIDLEAQLSNQGDSVSLFGRSKELFVGTTLMENSSISAGANDNIIDLNIEFSGRVDSLAAQVGAKMVLSNTPQVGRELSIDLLPTSLRNTNDDWQVSSQGIKISSKGVDIDNMMIKSRNQSLSIAGRASSLLRDTVKIDLHRFDLSMVTSVIGRVGYQLDGLTSGQAVIASALRDARLEADIAIDSISINDITTPNMRMLAQWDSKLNQARLNLVNRVNRDTLVQGYYIPSKVMYYAKLSVDSVNMNLLDPPLGGVLVDTKGFADVDIELQGERRAASLSGDIRCYGLETTIGYTGARYSLPEGVITLKENTLSAQGLQINDRPSNGKGSALLDLEVDLSQIRNVRYNIDVKPRNMIVLDTDDENNDLFYGRVSATGVASIKGTRNNVEMNITAMSDDNSQFVMPLNSKSSISQADFITFVKPKVEVGNTTAISRKRESFQRQQVATTSKANIIINMAVQVRPNTDVQLIIDPTMGDMVRAKGNGNFNMRIEPKSSIFEIYGDYSITEGSYLFTLGNIVNKRFSINPGSTIQWSGDPMDAILDIDAVYKLKTSLQPLMADESTRAVPVDCIINLSDRLMQPTVTFAIDLPSSDAEQQAVVANLLNDQEAISRQFFYLMLSNSFIAEASGVSSDLGVSATAATGFELLANQLSSWLSTSDYSVVLRYRPESDLTGDEIDVGFSKGWIDNRLLVELEGNYIIDNKQALSEDVSNFMGEAYVTWLIDRAGALRLKGFTQTVERYDENQGLQETGIGIYYREEFENFKDLRRRVKARFTADPYGKRRREAKRKDKAEQQQEEEENNK